MINLIKVVGGENLKTKCHLLCLELNGNDSNKKKKMKNSRRLRRREIKLKSKRNQTE